MFTFARVGLVPRSRRSAHRSSSDAEALDRVGHGAKVVRTIRSVFVLVI